MTLGTPYASLKLRSGGLPWPIYFWPSAVVWQLDMLEPLRKDLTRVRRNSSGASLIELAVSILLMSVVATGSIGAIAVGTRVASHVDDQDTSFITARSQAEYVASLPSASSYPVYPSAPSQLSVTTVVVTETGDSLQQLGIRVSRDNKELAAFDVLKAQRFVSPGIVPPSGGLTKVKTVSVPPLGTGEGFAEGISQVFPSTALTDILVRWHVDATGAEEIRTVAIYQGRPFGVQTQGITTAPLAVNTGDFPLLAIGSLKVNPALAVAARGIATGDYTVYFFNDSDSNSVVTQLAELSCLCKP